MTMKGSKGLAIPVVALPGVGHMPAKGEDEQEAARVFYVAATRATQRLVIGVGGLAKGRTEHSCHFSRVNNLKHVCTSYTELN